MDGGVEGWTDGCMDGMGCMDEMERSEMGWDGRGGRMDGRMDVWMAGMGGWMDRMGWDGLGRDGMDEWMTYKVGCNESMSD